MNFETDERRDLRAAVHQLAQRFGHDYWLDQARSRRHPSELWSALAESGFAGVNLSTEHGGGGGDIYDLMIVVEELAAAGLPLMSLVVSPAICGTLIERFGTSEQRDSWLRGIATGRERMAFAITEPDAGSNSHALRAKATATGDGWLLQGEKYYISGVDDARAILVVARTGTDPNGRGRLSLFVVPTDAVGVTYSPISTQVLATERQFTVSLDAQLPPESLLGAEGAGMKLLFEGLNPERIMSAALCNGISRYVLTRAAEYARTRSVWGAPIGTHQAIAHPLARAHVEAQAARLMTIRACELEVAGEPSGAESNMAKLLAADAAQNALDAAIQTHGGNGLSDEYGIANLWGLTRLYQIAPVSREMILNHIAQHELRLPRSYGHTNAAGS